MNEKMLKLKRENDQYLEDFLEQSSFAMRIRLLVVNLIVPKIADSRVEIPNSRKNRIISWFYKIL